MFNDYRLSVLPDEKSSGNGTAVMVVHYKYTLNCTFKNGQDHKDNGLLKK